jgi:hypothetical protein
MCVLLRHHCSGKCSISPNDGKQVSLRTQRRATFRARPSFPRILPARSQGVVADPSSYSPSPSSPQMRRMSSSCNPFPENVVARTVQASSNSSPTFLRSSARLHRSRARSALVNRLSACSTFRSSLIVAPQPQDCLQQNAKAHEESNEEDRRDVTHRRPRRSRSASGLPPRRPRGRRWPRRPARDRPPRPRGSTPLSR